MILAALQQTPFYQAKYFDETYVSPLGIGALLALCALQFAVPRRLALLPFLLLICFVPCSQRISVLGLDFSFLRIQILCAWLRLLSRGELRGFRWLLLDKIVLGWGIVESIAYILLHHDFAAVVYMSGRMLESLGGYYLVRMLVRDFQDLRLIGVAAAWIAIPVAICFAIEKSTGRNFFAVFGGVPEHTPIRQGKLRAMGAIGNPILAGCFWVALLPYMGALWWTKAGKTAALLGVFCGTVVIVACASSTPLAAFMAGLLGAYLFQFRYQMHSIRWSVVAFLGAMQCCMNRPIWHLMTSIDLVGGSTGYHRFLLIDSWIRHPQNWFLLGTKSTASWGPGLEDITNQYILEATRGGFGAFVLFMAMVVVAFRYVGQLWRSVEGDPELRILAWAVGVSLFIHCSSFMAVSYFAQVVFGWSLSLGIVAGLTSNLSTVAAGAPAGLAAALPQRTRPAPIRRRGKLLGEAT